MNRSTGLALAAAALAALLFLLPSRNDAAPARPAAVARGEYLVRVGGCGDCHTPMKFNEELKMPVPDLTRLLSGHPKGAPAPAGTLGPGDQAVIGPTFTSFKLPIGTVYAPNITSDKRTGLGSWTEAQFVQTMRTGKHLGVAQPVLPPMPWMNLAAATDADLQAMFAYLQAVPAIENAAPGPEVSADALASLGEAYEKLRAGLAPTRPAPAKAKAVEPKGKR